MGNNSTQIMKKIGVLYICTGKYHIFWRKFYQSCEQYLLKNGDYEIAYYVFTDAENIDFEDNNRVNKIYQEPLSWPFIALYRFKIFNSAKPLLQKMDYLYFFNANTLFVGDVGEDFLPQGQKEFSFGQHHWAWGKKPKNFGYERNNKSYERNNKSLAYIPKNQGNYYFMGGLNGGICKSYLAMTELLEKNTDIDYQNNIIALWHDESHLNNFASKNAEKIQLLSPSYGFSDYQTFQTLPFKAKIQILDKNKGNYGGSKFLRNNRNIIINIFGGLGSQMFQYAFAFAVAKKSNQSIQLDVAHFKKHGLRDYQLGLFNIKATLLRRQIKKLIYKYKKGNIFIEILKKLKIWESVDAYYLEMILDAGRHLKIGGFADTYYPEPHFHFDKKALKNKEEVYFKGYWQSEQYFKSYRNELLKQFTLKAETHPKTKEYQQKITQTESISLHIRRGDYVTNKETNKIHGFCGLDYYQQAVLEISKHAKNPHFFIFSDDLTWAKDNLDFINSKTFVQLEKTTPDHEEMALMSLCKHNIIANSSFSWWGAWLNQNPDKRVIAPKKWFTDASINTQDLIPNTWIRL